MERPSPCLLPSSLQSGQTPPVSLTRVDQGVEVNLIGAVESRGAVKHAEGFLQGHGAEGGVVGGKGHAGQLGLEAHPWGKQ